MNIPEMKAVFLKILNGVPTSLSFFTMVGVACLSKTVPVKERRKLATEL